VTGEWRKLYDEKLIDLYGLPNVRAINAGRMGWTGHVARMDKGKM
jgi:hypothetical protein